MIYPISVILFHSFYIRLYTNDEFDDLWSFKNLHCSQYSYSQLFIYLSKNMKYYALSYYGGYFDIDFVL
jgi:hypothetical protein